MEIERAVLALAALSQSTRLLALRTLVRYEPDGRAAGDLARLLEVPQNTLSAHLSILSRADLATSERHSRSIISRASLAHVQKVALFLLRTAATDGLKSVRPSSKVCGRVALRNARSDPVPEIYNVLFLCTGNSARSILAESILRKDGAGRFRSSRQSAREDA